MDHIHVNIPQYQIATKRNASRLLEWLSVRSHKLCLLNDTLYHKGADGIWRHTARQFEKETVLREAHCGIVGGHYASETIARKIWNMGYVGQPISKMQSTITNNAICVN